MLIDGDSADLFSVASIETLHLVPDPELPHARVWETLLTVNGPGPISMRAAKAVDITVRFACPAQPLQTSFNAVAVLVAQGTTSPSLMQVPIEATVNPIGGIAIETFPSPALIDGILPGQSADCVFVLKSTLDHDISGGISCVSAVQSIFSSPNVPVSVPAEVERQVTVPVTCAPGTPPGRVDQVPFRLVLERPHRGLSDRGQHQGSGAAISFGKYGRRQDKTSISSRMVRP